MAYRLVTLARQHSSAIRPIQFLLATPSDTPAPQHRETPPMQSYQAARFASGTGWG